MSNYVQVTIGRVFRRVLREWGYEPEQWIESASASEKMRVSDCVNTAFRHIWQLRIWPQFTVVKRILWRAEWNAETTYFVGDEVAYRNADGIVGYYRAVTDSIGAVPNNSAAWEDCKGTMLPTVKYSEHLIDELDLLKGCYDQHPERYRGARCYEMCRSAMGATCSEIEYPLEPYIVYRPLCAEFSWAAYDATKAYGLGDVVFLGDSCYEAVRATQGENPAVTIDAWREILFPQIFEDYVCMTAAAQRMQDVDGRARQLEKAAAEADRLVDLCCGQISYNKRAKVRVI